MSYQKKLAPSSINLWLSLIDIPEFPVHKIVILLGSTIPRTQSYIFVITYLALHKCLSLIDKLLAGCLACSWKHLKLLISRISYKGFEKMVGGLKQAIKFINANNTPNILIWMNISSPIATETLI